MTTHFKPSLLGGIKALRFTGDTSADILRGIMNWECSQKHENTILIIAFESQWEAGESAIVYYEE